MIRPPAGSRSRSSATTTSTFAQRAALDDLGDRAGRRRPRRRRARSPSPSRLEQLEQPLVAEGGHLDRLAERRPPLALGQRPQERDVDDDRGRLVERADQVLALGQVHAGLAADRRVDLGDERRRDVDERDAAQVGRREEPGRVAERAAADATSGSPRSTRSAASSRGRVLDDGQPLGVLALRQQDALDGPAGAPRAPAAIAGPTASHAPGSRDEDRAPGARAARSAAAEPPAGDARRRGRSARSRVSARSSVVPAAVAVRAASRSLDRLDDAADLGDARDCRMSAAA